VRGVRIICAFCGRDERDCDCERTRDARPATHLEAVVMTAAAMGRVNESTLRAASAVLREEPS
jgi:hypothetical protein